MRTRLLLTIVLVVIVSTGLFLYVRPILFPASSGTKIFELVVQGGKIVSGPQTLTVTEGDNVTIKVTADVTDEFHLHGYDLHLELQPGVQGQLTFIANLTGRFEFELESTSTALGVLEVLPR